MILADPTQIHQVLMNICTNAKHAIGEAPGTLRVSLSEIAIADTAAIEGCQETMTGPYLDLEISDTGCGMAPLTQSKIFDPFFTTKAIGKGTGIGLAVVHGIIKQHKGEITVSSKLGRGTTFHVYLPVFNEQEIESDPIASENIPQGAGERILFVDDETAIANMMQKKLTSLGYTPTVSTSSTEALEIYRKNPEAFDLVITDMTMPEMTGVELSRQLHLLRPKQPILLCSGFSETIDEEKAISLGISQLINKPFDQFSLAKAIRKVLQSS